MEKKDKDKKEELLSRREFFKNAAKKVLPILGAIVLSGSPVLSKAAEKNPMDCDYSCHSTCAGRCTNACTGCSGVCQMGCQGTCKGGCDRTCTGSCSTTCSGTCSGKCSSASKY